MRGLGPNSEELYRGTPGDVRRAAGAGGEPSSRLPRYASNGPSRLGDLLQTRQVDRPAGRAERVVLVGMRETSMGEQERGSLGAGLDAEDDDGVGPLGSE